ncbi:TolC family protein [Roseobacter sp. HKCCA0434]|uniref:TolC family protein n=1 Tax=Roseobacter sp. HKCCA0434 TaxID=3079297 RepID=UPI002905BEED|nr:TolC family protein [Roseobacter sp. HKCCA0434]
MAIDTIDQPVFAAEGEGAEVAAVQGRAEDLREGSPIYRAQVGRFGLGPPVAASARRLGEMRDFGRELGTAEAVPVATRTDLATLAAIVRRSNSDVARAAEAVVRADIVRDNAGLALAPRVGGDLEYARVNEDIDRTAGAAGSDGTFDRASVRVEATQPILDLGALAARDAAEAEQGVARASYAAQTQAAIFDLTAAYLRGLEAQQRTEFTTRRLERVRAQIAAEARLLDAGRSVGAARSVLDVERGSAEADIALLAQDLGAVLSQIARLSGQAVDALEPLDYGAGAFAAAEPIETYLARAMEANPLMQQRRLETLRQRDLYREAVARDFAPRLEGFARGELEQEDGAPGRIGNDTDDYSVGLRLSVPIFNRAGTGYAHRVAESDYRDAALAEVSLQRELEAEIRTLVRRIEDGRSAVVGAERSLRAARELVQAERAAVAVGQAAPVAVLAREIQLLRVEESLLLRRYEVLRARARLAFLTGSDPVEALL